MEGLQGEGAFHTLDDIDSIESGQPFRLGSRMNRIESVLGRMKAAGWKPGSPVMLAEVDAAEMRLGFMFPSAYREYLVAAGRANGPSSSWRGLWDLDQLVSLNQSLPLFQWFGGLVGIGNEGFMVVALNFREARCPVVTLGMSSSIWEEINQEADCFEEWLEGTIPPA